jgi:hypothetical protein
MTLSLCVGVGSYGATLWKLIILSQIDLKQRNKIIMKIEDKKGMGYQRVIVNGMSVENVK